MFGAGRPRIGPLTIIKPQKPGVEWLNPCKLVPAELVQFLLDIMAINTVFISKRCHTNLKTNSIFKIESMNN